MLAGLLATGRIRDPVEFRFLQGRLEEIEQRLKDPREGPAPLTLRQECRAF
jgi:hypothetical protein